MFGKEGRGVILERVIEGEMETISRVCAKILYVGSWVDVFYFSL